MRLITTLLIVAIIQTGCVHLRPKGCRGGSGNGGMPRVGMGPGDQANIERQLEAAERGHGNLAPASISTLPSGVSIQRTPQPEGIDLMRPLIENAATTCATVSTDNRNAAMENHTVFLDRHLKEGISTFRHSTLPELIENILQRCRGMHTLIIGTHGHAGIAGELDISNADLLARAIRASGIRRVIFSSCDTGAHLAGVNFLEEVARLSGASAIAWNRELLMHPTGGVQIEHAGGERITAIPRFDSFAQRTPSRTEEPRPPADVHAAPI